MGSQWGSPGRVGPWDPWALGDPWAPPEDPGRALGDPWAPPEDPGRALGDPWAPGGPMGALGPLTIKSATEPPHG